MSFYAEKVKTIYTISCMKTTDRIVDILQARLLQHLFIDLPQHQIQRLLKLQKECAGFVLINYATCEEITKLKWLLVPRRINLTISKLIFKGLLKENVPENQEIQVRKSNQSLRTLSKVTLEYANLQKQQ